MMQIVKKPCFTLLELLIVLFILSFGIILTGVKIAEVYREQRFLSEAQQVLSHLAMAQDLMLIMDTDVQVKFAPDDKKTDQMQFWLEVEKPIEEPWACLLKCKSLAAIQSLEFQGKSMKDLTLQFSLGRMSQGKLVLFEGEQGQKEKRQFEIELLGYPSPIGIKQIAFEEQANEENTKSKKSQSLYPNDVYEKLYTNPDAKSAQS